MSHSRTVIPYVALPLTLALVLGACGPSVDGEKKTWERTNANVKTLSADYPTFKTVMEAQQKTATAAWTAAGKAGGDEEKAKAMKAANESLSKLVNRVGEVKSKTEGVESTIAKLGKLKLPKDKSKKRSAAMAKARQALTDVSKAMAEAAPTDEASAMAALDPIISKLISAKGAASSTLSKYGKKKRKKKKKKKKK